MTETLNSERLAEVTALHHGCHRPGDKMCAMEAVAYVAGEPWSDTPKCACPVIGAFMRAWNDGLPDTDRTALLLPLIPRLIGTRATLEVEKRRATMAADWLIRVHTPAWLRLANLGAQADALERLPEIADVAQCPGLMPTLEAVRSDAAAARVAAWDAARDAARVAARVAARDAALAAASEAAWDAARAAASEAALAAAWAAARAASEAAWAAALAAARDALADTKRQLQRSAVELVIRMCEMDPPRSEE